MHQQRIADQQDRSVFMQVKYSWHSITRAKANPKLIKLWACFVLLVPSHELDSRAEISIASFLFFNHCGVSILIWFDWKHNGLNLGSLFDLTVLYVDDDEDFVCISNPIRHLVRAWEWDGSNEISSSFLDTIMRRMPLWRRRLFHSTLPAPPPPPTATLSPSEREPTPGSIFYPHSFINSAWYSNPNLWNSVRTARQVNTSCMEDVQQSHMRIHTY